MQRIDLAALDSRIDESNTVDIFPPAAPPAYHQLPEQVQKRSQIAVANSEEEAPVPRQDIPIEQDSSESSSSESDLSKEDDDAELFYSEDSDSDSLLYEKDGGSDQLLGQQDWDNVSGDLTKRYNRLKQHVGAIHASARGAGDVVKPLPAQNQFAQRQRTLQLQAQRRAQHQHAAAAASTASASASSSKSSAATTSTTAPGVHASKVDSSLAALSSRYSSSLNLSPLASARNSHGGITYLEPSFTSNAATRKGGSERHQVSKDKSDRATTEQVLDDRTRLVLYKMLGRGRLERVEGCVSTGKEANVYHALGRLDPDSSPPSPLIHLAIKIYKTSILTFKARSKYLVGEHRFKNGYSKVKNPRKMVRLWAEKEMRNLKRLEAAGVRCPKAVEVRGNVLVMTFLGRDGPVGGEADTKQDIDAGLPQTDGTQESASVDAADKSFAPALAAASATEDGSVIPALQHAEDWEASPRLKDAAIPSDRLSQLYIETLHILRRLWKVCKLVHADFSEYNILYSLSDGHLYTIDVSQSVEGDHPHAFDFLRADIGNVDEFFARRGVRTLGLKRTFELTVEDWGNGDESEEQVAEEMERRFALADEAAARVEQHEVEASAKDAEERTLAKAAIDNGRKASHDDEGEEDRVFKQSYIPRNLNEVFDPERDVQRVLAGEKDQLIYSQTVGIVAPTPTAPPHPSTVEATEDASSESDSDSSSEEGSEGEGEGDEKTNSSRPRGKRHEDKDEKRERKNAVKEEKREKRREKMPKKLKNAKVKKTSGKNRK